MGFKKEFRAAPVKLGPHYRAIERRRQGLLAAKVLGGGAVAGLLIGIFAALASNDGLGGAGRSAILFSRNLGRAHAPPAGAYYAGCNEARAAGVAPIYADEPGYRPEMDGDDDGIACEPYRGR